MKNKQAIIIAVTIIAVVAIGALAWKGSNQG